MPRVSVVISTHNRWDYLQQAIRSVLDQTFHDLELIVVDDGSQDATAEGVPAIPDARIRYLRQDRGERSRARNHGMEAAGGEFVALLDDDDLFLPEKTERQVEVLDSHAEVDLVACGTRIVDCEGKLLAVARPWLRQPEPGLFECLSDCVLLPSHVMFRRRALDRLDTWFDPDLSLAEDADFFVRLAHTGCRMAWVPQVLAVYRLRAEGSAKQSIAYMIALKKALDAYFGRDDVPQAILARKGLIYANRHLLTALRAFAVGLPDMGERFLLAAIRCQPTWAGGDEQQQITAGIARFAAQEVLQERTAFVDSVFDRLPEPLSGLQDHRGEAKAQVRQYLAESRQLLEQESRDSDHAS